MDNLNLRGSQSSESDSEQETDPEVEAYLKGGYDKHIRRARNALFIIAGIQLLSTVFISNRIDPNLQVAVWTETLIIAAIFVIFAFWSRKKPYAALLASIILYLVYQGLILAINPSAFFQGIILKIIIVLYLFLGLSNAKSNF